MSRTVTKGFSAFHDIFFKLQVCCVLQRSEQVSVHSTHEGGTRGERWARAAAKETASSPGAGGAPRCQVPARPGGASVSAETAPLLSEAREDGTWGPSPFVSNCPHSPPVGPTTGSLSTRRVWRLDRTQGLEHTGGCRQTDEQRPAREASPGCTGLLSRGSSGLGLFSSLESLTSDITSSFQGRLPPARGPPDIQPGF